jgi:hypothetical protein
VAITPEADKAVAKNQLAELREAKRRAKGELDRLDNVLVQARRQELRDIIDVLTAQIEIVRVRDPDDPGDPIEPTTTKATRTQTV